MVEVNFILGGGGVSSKDELVLGSPGFTVVVLFAFSFSGRSFFTGILLRNESGRIILSNPLTPSFSR